MPGLAQLDQHQICKPVMVSVVSSNPTGGNFILLRHLDAKFVQNDRNVKFVLFTKTSFNFLNDKIGSNLILSLEHVVSLKV